MSASENWRNGTEKIKTAFFEGEAGIKLA